MLRRLRDEKFAELSERMSESRKAGRAEDLKGYSDAPPDDPIKTEGFVRLSQEVAALDRAIGSWAQGRYGICLDMDCETEGRSIAQNRLEAVPFASRCAACETRREEEKKKKKK